MMDKSRRIANCLNAPTLVILSTLILITNFTDFTVWLAT